MASNCITYCLIRSPWTQAGGTSPDGWVTSTQSRNGNRLNPIKASSVGGPLALNTTAGAYTLQRLALMMDAEMDESRLVSQFGQYYP